MKTDMRDFCDAYSGKLEPFAATLKHALERSADGNLQLDADWRGRLLEVSHRTENLLGKIARQHAYLLIFGPLKSGKSTLMNAISAAYVSEVSSLPAYPALVYVRHGEQRSFSATTYAGGKLEFDSSRAMSESVAAGHAELASRILEVERAGESFDPQQHYVDAIRRVDIQVPATALAESGSVLVDTPGLYTRMRFGYDAMTRDFRDTASCAIFVVKSDNLFFEKVFEEFNELLGNFSRIFLVVNIDSSKRDLSASGDLEPSLESREPGAVVEAFQSLAMSAPLREAFEQGRLQVYPIDLLKAASKRLSHAGEASASDASGMADGDHDDSGGDGFEVFLNDLTDYLNSSAYLREFVQDSLRVGDSMQGELADLAGGDFAAQLASDLASCRTQLDDVDATLKALQETANLDWTAAFGEMRQEKDRLIEEFTNKDRSKLVHALHEALDQWLDSDASLQALTLDHLGPLVEREVRADADAIMTRLRSMVHGSNGGARLSASQAQAIERAGLRIAELAPGLFDTVCERELPEPQGFELLPEDVPVKRSLGDILAFRNGKTTSERLFGQDGSSTVTPADKRRRIGGKYREALREKIAVFPRTDLPQVQKSLINRMLEAYVEALRQAVEEQRGARGEQLEDERRQCEGRLRASEALQAVFDELLVANTAFGVALGELRQQHASQLEHADSALAVEPDADSSIADLDEVVLLDLDEMDDD